ncbi:glycosyltransferase family 8 protein [Ancylobacter lacus]|uniref:glycosyltransferase family 8 protein n=1 Tax=Ancylobacter lacus TaxID=2579970 RepID=UPI001BCAC709|nr:glycosyltransferase family 8 protein [Ancylobacter lacus]
MRRLTVVTVTDRTYVELTGVMLLSLAAHGGEAVSAVHVFGTGLTDRDRARLSACHPRPADLHIHDVDQSIRDVLGRLVARTHVSPSAYVRLLIPHLLPQVGERMLYVDCDTLINAPLAPLVEVEMGGHAVAAVRDARTSAHGEWNRRLGLPEDTPYLNSGVLLIDPAAWRAAGLSRHSLDIALNQGDRLRLMDQDALNLALAGRWQELPRTWNYYETSYVSRRSGNVEGFAAANIIHFVGRSKPNHADCRHPATAIWRAHRARSPWARAPLSNAALRNVRVYVVEALRRVGRLARRCRDAVRRRPPDLPLDDPA